MLANLGAFVFMMQKYNLPCVLHATCIQWLNFESGVSEFSSSISLWSKYLIDGGPY